MESNKKKLILASQSPRRKELLGWLNIPFEIKTSSVDEISSAEDPEIYATEIALLKGRDIFSKLENSSGSFLIAADTIVVLNGKIYGKPKDKSDARIILNELSNQTHQVITGVCFIFKNEMGKLCEHYFHDETAVTFNEITEDLMVDYLATNDSLDKAGAYGIQGPSLTFIKKIKGSYSNVVGFPLDKIIEELKIIFGEGWRECFERSGPLSK